MGRIHAAATWLLALASIGAAQVVPDREELLRKSPKQLKALLKERGATCKKCIEKEDLVERLLETWDWSGVEAVSPDGKTRMTKDIFVKNLEASYRRHLGEVSSKQKTQTDGHQLASEDEDEEEQIPDVDKVWLDFSENLRRGEIKTDAKGDIIYSVAGPQRELGIWDKYKTHIMISVNVIIL